MRSQLQLITGYSSKSLRGKRYDPRVDRFNDSREWPEDGIDSIGVLVRTRTLTGVVSPAVEQNRSRSLTRILHEYLLGAQIYLGWLDLTTPFMKSPG